LAFWWIWNWEADCFEDEIRRRLNSLPLTRVLMRLDPEWMGEKANDALRSGRR